MTARPAHADVCAASVLAAVLLAVLLLALAIASYPGGSERDPRALGFDAWNNYLCDLLREVAIGGRPNPASALARASMLVFVAGLVPFFLLLSALVPPRLRHLVRALGAASALGWAAVALTPSDRFAAAHVVFIVAGIVPGVVAASAAVLGLALRPATRPLAFLGAGALLCVAADGALYLLLQATGDPSFALVVPALQKIAGAFLITWMIAVSTAVLGRGRRLAPFSPSAGAPRSARSVSARGR